MPHCQCSFGSTFCCLQSSATLTTHAFVNGDRDHFRAISQRRAFGMLVRITHPQPSAFHVNTINFTTNVSSRIMRTWAPPVPDVRDPFDVLFFASVSQTVRLLGRRPHIPSNGSKPVWHAAHVEGMHEGDCGLMGSTIKKWASRSAQVGMASIQQACT